MYRKMLESSAYNLDVKGCMLARFDASGGPNAQTVEVPYFEREAATMLGTALSDAEAVTGFDRDALLRFNAATHKYSVRSEGGGWALVPKSVTGIVSSYAPPFVPEAVIARMKGGRAWGPGHKYWGMSDAEIKAAWNAAADLGTSVHNKIEAHYKHTPTAAPQNTHAGFETFCMWAAEEGLKPYRSEWPVHCGLVAGTVDMVYSTPDGAHYIVDWKITDRPFLSSNFGTPLR